MSNTGKLYLIPNLLGGDTLDIIPPQTQQIVWNLNEFIVENVRNARRYLIKLGIKKQGKQIDNLVFHELPRPKKGGQKEKRDPMQSPKLFLQSAFTGTNIGLISEAGCPAIADPGAKIVDLAHQQGIEVVPLVGPSSLLLALMASGLNGQNFAFVGYLPIQQGERVKRIRELERRVLRERQTQLFIETPYRNESLFADLIKNCQANTKLSIAIDLTLPTQFILTQRIQDWKKFMPNLRKRPALFLLGK